MATRFGKQLIKNLKETVKNWSPKRVSLITKYIKSIGVQAWGPCELHYDPAPVDVLYIKLENVEIHNSYEDPEDSEIIINLDKDNNIVGVQILYASEHLWSLDSNYYDPIPPALVDELRNWAQNFRTKESK